MFQSSGLHRAKKRKVSYVKGLLRVVVESQDLIEQLTMTDIFIFGVYPIVIISCQGDITHH